VNMSSMLRCLLFETVAVDAVDCVDCWDELGAVSVATAVFSTSSTRFSSAMVGEEKCARRDPRDRVSARSAGCPHMETQHRPFHFSVGTHDVVPS